MKAPGAIDQAVVNDALSHWRQGDCVLGEHWFVHRISPELPLTDAAREAASEGNDLAESPVRGFAVLTQTCDIVRLCGDRPYVEVAALVDVDAATLTVIQRGRRPRYAFLPGIAGHCLVADLDRVMTVEKTVVAGWERVSGCDSDEAAARELARALTRKHARFAFPDDFSSLTRKLQDRLLEKHAKSSLEGEAFRSLREVRVRALPSWDDGSIDLMFWFVRKDDVMDFDGTSWHELLYQWLKLVPAARGRFQSVDGVVVGLDDLSAREYVESHRLDLDHLSSNSS